MKKFKDLLFSVHPKYLYAAIAAMVITSLLTLWGGIGVPLLAVIIVAFCTILLITPNKGNAYWWYMLPVGIGSLIMQVIYWVFK